MISPSALKPDSWLFWSRIFTSIDVATPAERGLRCCGGSGLQAIIPHSVMPYDSIIGTPKSCSKSLMSCCDIAVDDERTNRKLEWTTLCLLARARARIAWCMLGTAVNHVG